MKAFLFLALALFVSSCAGCGKEDEEYGPYPTGSKNSQSKPQVQK